MVSLAILKSGMRAQCSARTRKSPIPTTPTSSIMPPTVLAYSRKSQTRWIWSSNSSRSPRLWDSQKVWRLWWKKPVWLKTTMLISTQGKIVTPVATGRLWWCSLISSRSPELVMLRVLGSEMTNQRIITPPLKSSTSRKKKLLKWMRSRSLQAGTQAKSIDRAKSKPTKPRSRVALASVHSSFPATVPPNW